MPFDRVLAAYYNAARSRDGKTTAAWRRSNGILRHNPDPEDQTTGTTELTPLNLVINTSVPTLSQRGQGMVEYAMILTLVGLVVVVMLVATGHVVTNLLSNVSATMRQAGL